MRIKLRRKQSVGTRRPRDHFRRRKANPAARIILGSSKNPTSILQFCCRPARITHANRDRIEPIDLHSITETFIISLLGKKPWGSNEFSFYSSFDDTESF
jgi:hypothetical protein